MNCKSHRIESESAILQHYYVNTSSSTTQAGTGSQSNTMETYLLQVVRQVQPNHDNYILSHVKATTGSLRLSAIYRTTYCR